MSLLQLPFDAYTLSVSEVNGGRLATRYMMSQFPKMLYCGCRIVYWERISLGAFDICIDRQIAKFVQPDFVCRIVYGVPEIEFGQID